MTTPPELPSDASGPRGPERPWSAGGLDPEDPQLLARLGLELPDDPRELDRLGRQVRREAKRNARGARGHTDHADRLDGLTGRAAATGIAVSLLLLVFTVGFAGTLTALITPRPLAPRAGGLPLAQTTGEVGTVGGLLPDAGARLADDTGIALRNLRPSVLFVPRATPATPCADCGPVLDSVASQAAEYGIGLYVVVAADDAERGRALVKAAANRNARLVVDEAGAVGAAFGAATDRLVLVHADGIVGDIRDGPGPGDRLEPLLVGLPRPGAADAAGDLRPSARAD